MLVEYMQEEEKLCTGSKMTRVDLFLNVQCPVSEDLVQQLMQKLSLMSCSNFSGHIECNYLLEHA